jgi:homoserine kinase type II
MAVYTDVSFEELESFLAAYDLGEAHVFKGIAEGVSNSNYYLQTGKGAYILTLYEKRVEEEDLPFYLGLMEHLAKKGINAPTPLRTRGGKITGVLNGKPAAILTFLDGISLRRPAAEHCAQLGSVLADMHAAGANFPLRRKNAMGHAGWKLLADGCIGAADSISDGLRALIEDELSAQGTAWPEGLPSGIVHADLFPDNVLFVKDKVSGLIDFYFACNDVLALDLAVMLNSWCFEADHSFNITKSRALLGAYQAKRKFQPAEREAMPLLCRGAALRFLLTRLYDWVNHEPGALVRPKDPREFARRLRFHRNVRGPEAYGL